MAIDPAQLTVVTFKVEQQELSDLLTGTERWYQRIPRFEEQPTDPVNPDSREAKVRSRVLPRNPYFKECCREAREVLGIPREGVDRCDTTDFACELAPISIDKHIRPWLWGAWWLAIHLVKSNLNEPHLLKGLPSCLPQ